MKFDIKDLNGLGVLSIKDFIDKYHKGLTVPSINYCILSDKIDYVQPGNERLIVLTEKTLRYQPNRSKARKETLSL